MKNSKEAQLEWFGGNKDAVNMFNMFIDLAHTWDDLVDKDNDVSEDHINNAFLIALVYLQANPFYKSIEADIRPMWMSVILAYDTANRFEKNKDAHGLEIAHGLRYAAGHIIAYAVQVCVGTKKAKEYLPEIWKNIISERFDRYREEHLNE
jgi:hypothetical protein